MHPLRLVRCWLNAAMILGVAAQAGCAQPATATRNPATLLVLRTNGPCIASVAGQPATTLKDGDRIAAGTSVKTARTPPSSMMLLSADGLAVTLESDSTLVIDTVGSATQPARWTLREGAVVVKVVRIDRTNSPRLTVRVQLGDVQTTGGTLRIVSRPAGNGLMNNCVLSCIEGALTLVDLSGDKLEIPGGQEMVMIVPRLGTLKPVQISPAATVAIVQVVQTMITAAAQATP